MRVLLINSNLKDDVLAAPPIGLCYVATAADMAGHEIQVLDLCFRRRPLQDLDAALRDFEPQVVGVSVRNIDNVNMLYPTSYLPMVRKIVRRIRERSDATIVIGGAGASINPEHVCRYLEADYVVVSEGERSFVSLLRALEDGTGADDLSGVGYIRGDRFRYVRARLQDFPLGNPDLGKWIDVKPYSRIGSSYSIQTSRGCRHRCVYCVYPVIEGHQIRWRSPSDVVDEIEDAHGRFGAQEFEFVDSVFNESQDHAAAILEEVIRRSLKVGLTAMGISPRGLDSQFLDLMWRAGFRSFMLSPESASEELMKNYGKNLDKDDIVRAAEAINRTRMTTLWYFLLGGPGETNDTLQETLDFVLHYLKKETHPPYHNVNMFLGIRIYPGTVLWNRALKEEMVSAKADPIEQCWYISHGLDLNRAIRQMREAAAVCPELHLGSDEGYMALSKVVAFFGELLGMPKPYWRHIWGLNRLLMKFGLRSFLGTRDMEGVVKNALVRQGYRGPHLAGFSSSHEPGRD